MSTAAGPHSRPEEALVSVDVAYAVQQFLVQQSCFDRGFALAEKLDEVFQLNQQRLGTRPCETLLTYFQPAKAPGIDKPQLTSGREFRDQVSVFLNLCF